jgi:hypothetical protein
MTDLKPPRSLTRVWLGVLVIVILAWLVYALSGGPDTPDAPPTVEGVPPAE